MNNELIENGISRLGQLGDESWLGKMRKRLGDSMPTAEILIAAYDAAKRHGLDPALVCAICEVESSWNPWAVRHEKGYHPLIGFYPATDDRHRRWYDAAGNAWWTGINLTPETRKYPWECRPLIELLMQQTSWGLMQIMGVTARERGFKGWLTELCDPVVNLEWSCQHLKHMELYAESYGIRQLADPSSVPTRLIAQTDDLAAAWNGGKVRRVKCPECNSDGWKEYLHHPQDRFPDRDPCEYCHDTGEVYANQPYVDKVLRAMENYK